jgi:hypothetical protein
MQISADGSGVDCVRLDDYFETVADKQLYSKNPDEYAKIAAENPEKYQGHYKVLRLVDYGGHTYRSFVTRQINIQPVEQVLPFVFKEVGAKAWNCTEVKVDPDTKAPVAATFEWDFYKSNLIGEKKKAITVKKTYAVKPSDYSIEITLEFINHLDKAVTIGFE